MTETIATYLKNRLPGLELNVGPDRIYGLPLGGRAAYFVEVLDSVELIEAVKAATDQVLPYLVLGQGRASLISDDGFPGLVIKNKSAQISFSADQSLVFAEAGAGIQQIILQAAQRGFGGLIPFYPQSGSLGGSLFLDGFGGLNRFVRSLTVLQPPTKIKPEPTIMRYKGEWLVEKDQQESRLLKQWQKARLDTQPVILSAQLQLTTLRMDEISNQLQVAVQQFQSRVPQSPFFGPLFQPLPVAQLDEILLAGEIYRYKHSGFKISREQPNYLILKPRYVKEQGGTIKLSNLLEYLQMIQTDFSKKLAVELKPAFLVH